MPQEPPKEAGHACMEGSLGYLAYPAATTTEPSISITIWMDGLKMLFKNNTCNI